METVLGDYLEAVGVDGARAARSRRCRRWMAAASRSSNSRPATRVHVAARPARWRRRCVDRRRCCALLEPVRTAASLAAALRARAQLAAGESLITAAGEWVGRDWLRVNRGGDVHAGVLEREHRLKGLRERWRSRPMQRVRRSNRRSASLRAQVERGRATARRHPGAHPDAHREHAELRGRLEALKARLEEAALRRARIEAEQAEVALDMSRAQDEPGARARRARCGDGGAGAPGCTATGTRERARAAGARPPRWRASAHRRAQRRTARQPDPRWRAGVRRQGSMAGALSACSSSVARCRGSAQSLERTLADGDAPIAELELRLQDHLARRAGSRGRTGERAPRSSRTATSSCVR